MKKRYTEMMKHIYPTQEQKNNMLEKVFEPEPEKVKRGFRIKYCIPAVALAVIFSTTVFAEEIKNTFYGLLGKNEIVSEEVLNDVYTDTDGHVRMSVKEVLSDKITSYAIIEYTAFDEKGQDWLDNYLTVHKLNALTISPFMKDGNTSLYGVNYGYNCEEQLEYQTENTRVFKTSYYASGVNFGTDSVDLIYPLADKWENHAVIDVSESVTLKDVKIDSDKAPEKYYKPLGIKISPLSMNIYGKDLGIVEKGELKGGGTYTKVVHKETIDSLYLIMKDGSKHDLLTNETRILADDSGAMLACVSNPEIDYDCSIYSSAFRDYMDLSIIDGIELDGVYYPLGL